MPVSFSYIIFSSVFFFLSLLRLVFSVNTLSPSSDHPQQFPLFFFSSLDVQKIFTLFLRFFFSLHKFIPKCQRGAQSELCQKEVDGVGGVGHFIFHDFFSLNRSLENVCACQQRCGGVDSLLRLLNHRRIKTRGKKEYEEKIYREKRC